MKRPIWHFFLFILFVFVLLRLPLFWTPIMDVDEAIYGLFSRVWFDGGIPYLEGVETKPLGLYFLFGLIFKFTGKFNMFWVHMVTTVWMFATSYFLYLIVKMYGSKRAGIVAALFYAIFTTTYIPKIIATTIEPILLLPVTIHVYLWLRFERDRKYWMAFLSGTMLSAGMLCKYQAGINLIILFVYLLLVHPIFIKEMSFSERVKAFFIFLLGMVPLPLIHTLYLMKIGGFEEFWSWSIKGSLDYIAESSYISLFGRIVSRFLPFVAASFLLWALLAGRLKNFFKRNVNRNEWLILLWFLLSFIPVATGGRFYGHYFLLLLPPLCILAGQQLDLWWTDARPMCVKKFIVISTVVIAIGFLIPRFFMNEIYSKVGEDNPNDYKPVAEYIKNHTNPDDRILVWGYAPAIYWFAERLPAMRFFWSDLLAGRVIGLSSKIKYVPPQSEKYWAMFWKDVQKHKPVYFIDTAPAGWHDYAQYPIQDYQQLIKFLNDNYKQEATVDKAVIYKRISLK